MTAEKVEAQDTDVKPRHFLHFEKYIYTWAITGAISQILIMLVIVGHLITGLGITPELRHTCNIYSAIAIALLLGSGFSEILLMRAVNQRMLRFIQWWMTSTIVLLTFSILMTVISGFTLQQEALWITLAFSYMVIRLPFQIYFVDKFSHDEIIHKEPQRKDSSMSVLYRRVV